MTQNIIQIGNSTGVIIPQSFLSELGLKKGDVVLVEKKGKSILLIPNKTKKTSDVDVKFMKMVDEFMDEHDDVLRELANK